MICSECGLVVGDRYICESGRSDCYVILNNLYFRVIDVGSEWRTFSNEKSGVEPSRVGGPENPLLNGADLTTIIGPSRGKFHIHNANILFFQMFGDFY